jgi:hypothetical protein
MLCAQAYLHKQTALLQYGALLKWCVLMTTFFKNQHEGFLQHVLHTLPKTVVLAQKKGPQDILLVYTTKGPERGSVT